jgi:predicted PurR-regulated permease PerM
LLNYFDLTDLGALQERFSALLTQGGQVVAAQALAIGQNAVGLIFSFFVMLYLLFFLLRDGKSLTAQLVHALPLQGQHSKRLLDQFANVVRATVKGNFIVALVHGALGSLAFWFLGINGPVLWGAVMAVLSLVPAVGAALVWGPVAIYLLSTGSIAQGLGLTAWGVLVIGSADNVLRPILVGKQTRMPDYLVLVATLGGLSVFGLNGFVIGPVIAAIFIVAWDIFAQARQEDQPARVKKPPRG